MEIYLGCIGFLCPVLRLPNLCFWSLMETDVENSCSDQIAASIPSPFADMQKKPASTACLSQRLEPGVSRFYSATKTELFGGGCTNEACFSSPAHRTVRAAQSVDFAPSDPCSLMLTFCFHPLISLDVLVIIHDYARPHLPFEWATGL